MSYQDLHLLFLCQSKINNIVRDKLNNLASSICAGNYVMWCPTAESFIYKWMQINLLCLSYKKSVIGLAWIFYRVYPESDTNYKCGCVVISVISVRHQYKAFIICCYKQAPSWYDLISNVLKGMLNPIQKQKITVDINILTVTYQLSDMTLTESAHLTFTIYWGVLIFCHKWL